MDMYAYMHIYIYIHIHTYVYELNVEVEALDPVVLRVFVSRCNIWILKQG